MECIIYPHHHGNQVKLFFILKDTVTFYFISKDDKRKGKEREEFLNAKY